MSFIPVNLDDVVEAKPVANGMYDLQITEAKLTKSGEKSKRPGSPQFVVSIGFINGVDAPNITQFISLPHEEDEKKSSDYKALLLKRFLTLFSIPYNSAGIDPEAMAMSMVGATARAEVAQDEPTERGDVYNRLVVPKMRGEESTGRGAPPNRKR